MGREIWWNVDFDLALRQGRPIPHRQKLEHQIREMTMHALPATDVDDSLLVFEAPPGDFLRYLDLKAFPRPRWTVFPDTRTDARFTPFGWDEAAATLNRRYRDPASHPDLDLIRRINSRSFGHQLERECFGSDTPRGSFGTVGQLEGILDAEPERTGGWIVKTEHGNAAFGNRRLRRKVLNDIDRRWIGRHLQDGPMVLERWLDRTLDPCFAFDVHRDGTVGDARIHETVCTADGGYIGGLFDPSSDRLQPWKPELARAAQVIGSALVREGYWGPVCGDALVWADRSGDHLRPLVDLNARRHASESWHRLFQRWGGCLYGRYFSVRKLTLPDSYEAFDARLLDDAWDPDTRVGTLAVTPLRLGAGPTRRRPQKLGVVFRGPSRSAVLGMETRFRETFES